MIPNAPLPSRYPGPQRPGERVQAAAGRARWQPARGAPRGVARDAVPAGGERGERKKIESRKENPPPPPFTNLLNFAIVEVQKDVNQIDLFKTLPASDSLRKSASTQMRSSL